MKTFALISIATAVFSGSPRIHSAHQALNIPKLDLVTYSTPTSKARRAINFKLDTIFLDEVLSDSLPLGQVVEWLSREAKKSDISKRGINIIVTANADPLPSPHPPIDPVTGLSTLVVESEILDLSQVTIRIMPALTDVTLRQALDAIVKGADRPIKYSIEDYAVIFSFRTQAPQALRTRWFRINTNTFLRTALAVTTKDVGTASFSSTSGASTGGGKFLGSGRGVEYIGGSYGHSSQILESPWANRVYGSSLIGCCIDHVTIVSSGDQIIMAARQLINTMGVDLKQPGKQLFFNDRLGMLMLRATLQELDIIEQALVALNLSYPPVTTDTRSQHVLSPGVSHGATAGLRAESAEISAARNTGVASQPPGVSNLDRRTPAYADWVSRFTPSGVTGAPTAPQADFDQDGFPNLVEYGFGTSPIRADSVPHAEFLQVREGTEDYPAIQFRRRANANDLTYRVLFSSDLVRWNEGPSRTVAVSVADAEGMESVTIRSLTPLSGTDRQFLRIDLTVP